MLMITIIPCHRENSSVLKYEYINADITLSDRNDNFQVSEKNIVFNIAEYIKDSMYNIHEMYIE